MAQMLVQHAHALVAISQEAEGCAHTTRGNRGDPASYGVYTDVMAATTQAVKAVAHLTDHLLDPSLDAVAGAKPRFATQFARGFEETFGVTVKDAWKSGSVKQCPIGVTLPYTVHATPVRPSFPAQSGSGEHLLMCSRATFERGLGSGGNSESETQITAVPEYIVIGIEKSASELAADLALFTSGTASVLMMCKAKKQAQAEHLLRTIKKDWELSIALKVGKESFYITPLHDKAERNGGVGEGGAASTHKQLVVDRTKPAERTPDGKANHQTGAHVRPKEARSLKFGQFKSPEESGEQPGSKVAPIERAISKRLSFARHQHAATAPAAAALPLSPTSGSPLKSANSTMHMPRAAAAASSSSPDAGTETPAGPATRAFESFVGTASHAGEVRGNLVAGLQELFADADMAEKEFTKHSAKHRRHSVPDFLDKTELRFRLDKGKLERLLRDAGALHFFDKDGDGNVSVDEILAAADKNGDGQISLEEFLAVAQHV